jgi:hypothetical protein
VQKGAEIVVQALNFGGLVMRCWLNSQFLIVNFEFPPTRPHWPQPEAKMVVRASRPHWSSQTDDVQVPRSVGHRLNVKR